MKVGTLGHVKTKRLRRLLGVPLYQVAGILESLWQIAAESADEGDIGKYSNADIAEHIEWDGDPDELINMLVKVRWLDEDATRRLVIHDWMDHAPEFIKDRIAKRRLRQKNPDKSGNVGEVSDKSQLTQPNPTNSIPTQPNQKKSLPAEARESPKARLQAAFETWWSTYPKQRRVAKQAAEKAWTKAVAKLARHLPETGAIEQLQRACEAFAASPKGQGEFCPNAKTWLDGGRWDDDPESWNEKPNGKTHERVGAGQRYSGE